MPPRRELDPFVLDALLRRHQRVVTHAQLKEIGVAQSTISYRLRPEGPWQFAHPGVLIAHRGTPTRRERLLAALAYAGDSAVLTGRHALRLDGSPSPAGSPVRVLIPASRHRASRPGVAIERTHRLPAAVERGGVLMAPPQRALADACRVEVELDDVRELVSMAVQQRLCSVSDFGAEVYSGPRQRSALGRRVLEEVGDGVRSVAEARAREMVRRFGLPMPRWNVALFSTDGRLIAVPDAYWDVGVALEIDSMRWHLSARRYRRTQQRQRRLGAFGVIVIPTAPVDIIDTPDDVAAQTFAALREAAGRRPPAGLTVRPHTSLTPAQQLTR